MWIINVFIDRAHRVFAINKTNKNIKRNKNSKENPVEQYSDNLKNINVFLMYWARSPASLTSIQEYSTFMIFSSFSGFHNILQISHNFHSAKHATFCKRIFLRFFFDILKFFHILSFYYVEEVKKNIVHEAYYKQTRIVLMNNEYYRSEGARCNKNNILGFHSEGIKLKWKNGKTI